MSRPPGDVGAFGGRERALSDDWVRLLLRRSRGLAALVSAAVWMLAAGPSSGAPADPEAAGETGFLERPRLTGTWGGGRTRVEERGLVVEASYIAGSWTNLEGGRREGTRYEGFAELALDASLERLVDWKGGRFRLEAYSYHGGQPSDALVGAFPTQTVSGNEAVDSVRVFQAYLEQSWKEGRVLVKAGQLAADDDFFVAESADTLLNGTFGFLGLGRTQGVAPFYPLGTPGVFVRAQTQDSRWGVRAGVYSADPGRDERDNYGFDYSFDDGIFAILEVQARPRLLEGRTTLAAGVLGTTRRLEDYEDRGRVSGSIGLYAFVDHVLIEGSSSMPQLGVFLRGYGAMQEDRANVRWYVDTGLELRRPLPTRERDVFTIGFGYLRLSDDFVEAVRSVPFDLPQTQAVLEIGYRAQLTGWLSLQPNFQRVIDPSVALGEDATVVGVRARIEL